ncbi:hypothetical protein DICVIV_12809 [Dictyocaulus viviparus]|uniref:Uncharacterized protein n=1 Tax=Dictyocaulus viviparus TaxID=29172 RepID=A0A0D8XFU2_DICVI|nr:hypothetical protein DICVIV_12809 [Dictyocaulus viviparus]
MMLLLWIFRMILPYSIIGILLALIANAYEEFPYMNQMSSPVQPYPGLTPPVQTIAVYVPPEYNNGPYGGVYPGYDGGVFNDMFYGPSYKPHSPPLYSPYSPQYENPRLGYPYGLYSSFANQFLGSRYRRRRYHRRRRERDSTDSRDSRDRNDSRDSRDSRE